MLHHGRRLPLVRLTALSATAALILVTELIPVGLLDQMSADLGVSQGRIGFLATAYAGAATVAAIPLTAVTRSLPRRPLLIGLLLGFGVANAVTAVSSAYWLTFAVRILVGLLGGIAWSMLAGYAARIVPAERRGRAIAIALAGITTALALGLPAGTILAGWVGWRGCFGVLAAVAAGIAGWVRLAVPPLTGERRCERASLARVAARPGVGRVLAATGVLLLGHQAMYTYLTPYAARAGVDQPGAVLFVFGVSAVAGIWLTGVLVDRHLRAVTGGALATVAVALVLLAALGGNAGALIGGVALWGLAFGGVPTALQAALVAASGSVDANAAGSLQTTVYNLGVAGGSLVGGLVLDAAGPAALPWLAVPLVASALLITLRA